MAEEKQYDIDDILNELRGMPSAETEAEPEAEPEPSEEILLLREIRDSLKK